MKKYLFRIASFTLCLLTLWLGSGTTVQAIAQDDIDAINGGWVHWKTYDNASSGACGGTTVNLTGSENAEKVFNFLVSKGLATFQAAGVVGNMQAESSVQPQRLQGTPNGAITTADEAANSSLGWGIVQWTPAGKMINPTKAAGKDPNDLGVQLEFLWEQLTTGNEKAAGDALRKTSDVDEAAEVFLRQYERPADPDGTVEIRKSFSRQFLALYGSSVSSGTSINTNANTGGCSPDGSAAVTQKGLVSPPNLGAEVGQGYYKMPDPANGEFVWNGGAIPDDRCGNKALIDVIYTVAKRWAAKYPNNKMIVGDLNASAGHASHKNGVDVDIFTVGQVAANTSGDRSKSIELGHMFADTGIIKVIFYNDSAVQADFNSYVSANGLSGNMESWPGHEDHFHVRITDNFRLATSLGCP